MSKRKKKRDPRAERASAYAKLRDAIARMDLDVDMEHREHHPSFDSDRERYGQRVADFNAGFLAGREDGGDDVRGMLLKVWPAFRTLTAFRSDGTKKWSRDERREWDRAFRAIEKVLGDEVAKPAV